MIDFTSILFGIALVILLILAWKMAFGKHDNGVTITDEVRATVAIKLQKHRADELDEVRDYDWAKIKKAKEGLANV